MISKFIEDKLGSKHWRMNNLYMIEDKDSKRRILKLNPAQEKVLTKFRHKKKIILKSRQQGISTLYLAYYLDDCIFKPSFQAGIQSYGQAEAEKLSNRAELMWNHLDPEIKELMGIKLVANNSKGLYFSNGSILKVGSFRGDTLQGLHVSELGKIAKKYPEKARELKTGAFQAVGKNNRITIESTAEGKTGLFYDMWIKAMNNVQLAGNRIDTQSDKQLGPFDFQPVFLSWLEDPDCTIDIPPSDEVMNVYNSYLDTLSSTLAVAILPEQRWWYAAKAEELGNDMKQEYPTTPEEAFEQAIEGTYYAHEYERLNIVECSTSSARPLHSNRVQGNYDENLEVHSAFDLGMNDDFSIIFFQHFKGATSIVGEYVNRGHGLEHYRDIFAALSKDMGWRHGITYVPHDIKVRELIAGKTRWTALKELGFNPVLVKKHKVVDGIEATRQFLKDKNLTISKNCSTLLTAIQNYRKKYDSKYDVYLDAPQHDEFSHPADALRYLAMGLKHKPPHETIVKSRILNSSFSL